MKNTLLVEGWRGINHSYAMVNQHHLVALSSFPDLHLYFHDLPFPRPDWVDQAHDPGFPRDTAARIAAIPALPAQVVPDCTLSIAWPYQRSRTPSRRLVTFMTSEFSTKTESFAPGQADPSPYCAEGGRIVVPSRWSKDKLVEYGFPEAAVYVVSHGVDPELFFPASAEERAVFRASLGLSEEHFVFLNLGAMTLNKGIDVLLRAFVQVHRKYPQARLVLKDDKRLYGFDIYNVLKVLASRGENILQGDAVNAIKIVSATLPIAQMRLLYCAADAYVSPYRAEGFNLPVIEAIACGVPAIVTAGGATEDFCDARTGTRIESRLEPVSKIGDTGRGTYVEPQLESVIACMEGALQNPSRHSAEFEAGRQEMLRRKSWYRCTVDLLTVCFDHPVEGFLGAAGESQSLGKV